MKQDAIKLAQRTRVSEAIYTTLQRQKLIQPSGLIRTVAIDQVNCDRAKGFNSDNIY